MGLSSPNKMIWSCFRSLKKNVVHIENEHDQRVVKDIAALSIILCDTAVETFVNMYFRVLVEEERYQAHKDMVVNDSTPQGGKRAKGLKYKLNNWPQKILNKNIDLDKGIGKEFNDIRIIRNNLTHFVSDYETINVDGIEIKGLANTEAFDNLDEGDAEKAFRVAKQFIEYILLLSGVNTESLPHAVHQWAGIHIG